MSTLDKILIGCAGFLLAFVITMIILFCIFQAVPDVLIESVMQVFASEIVLTFIIWWVKKKSSRRDNKNDEKADK